MAKAILQNIPSEQYHLYTRGLTPIRKTGYNYYPGIAGYGYGGLISRRIAFRLRRWQDKHVTYLSSGRRKARDIFKSGVYNWHGTPYEYGTQAPNPGVKNKKYWWGLAEKGGYQYYRLFQSYTLGILHAGYIPDWMRIYELEYIGFGNWYFGGVESMYIARAYLSTDQLDIVDVTETKVLLDAVSFDDESCFDLVNHRYIAPIAGKYQVNVAIRYTNIIADGAYYVIVSKNGVSVLSVLIKSPVGGSISAVASDIIKCEKNDYLELYAYVSTGGIDTVDIDGGSSRTFMSIHPLPG